jgi:hypothetical protein
MRLKCDGQQRGSWPYAPRMKAEGEEGSDLFAHSVDQVGVVAALAQLHLDVAQSGNLPGLGEALCGCGRGEGGDAGILREGEREMLNEPGGNAPGRPSLPL